MDFSSFVTDCQLIKATLKLFHLKYQNIMRATHKRAIAVLIRISLETIRRAETSPRSLSRCSRKRSRFHQCFCVIEANKGLSSFMMTMKTKIRPLQASVVREKPDEFRKKMPHIIVRRKYLRLRSANFVQNLELMCRH